MCHADLLFYHVVYFDLIDEIDSERLVSAMQTVLALYPSESMPFAMSVVQRFAETFNRLVNTEADPDDDTTLLTAIQIFGAVSVRSYLSFCKCPQFQSCGAVVAPFGSDEILMTSQSWLWGTLSRFAGLSSYTSC
jgi:hypothetical protein